MLLYIPVNQARNKIEPLLLSHFGSLQRPLGNTVNRVHTRMPGVLRVSLETGQFRLRGIPALDEGVVALANESIDLLERGPQPLPTNFVSEYLQNFGELGVCNYASSPTIIGRINQRHSWTTC